MGQVKIFVEGAMAAGKTRTLKLIEALFREEGIEVAYANQGDMLDSREHLDIEIDPKDVPRLDNPDAFNVKTWAFDRLDKVQAKSPASGKNDVGWIIGRAEYFQTKEGHKAYDRYLVWFGENVHGDDITDWLETEEIERLE